VPLPSLSEQQKIADILGAWDVALEKLDALIAAKERRKQALMQQLLTGKRRLPQFGGSWRWLRLDEICERIDRKAPTGIERVLSITAGAGFQDQRDKFSRVIAGRNIENYVHLRRGEFSYNKGNSNLYPQGCIYRLEEYDEGAVPNVWVSFAIKSADVDSNFLKQYFLAGGHNHQLSRLINYGVRNDGLLNLTADNFFSIKIPVPPKEEQQRLGELFEGLASELAILRRQRAALDQQKRGLMQQLLTGQKRVTTTS
jgi:type I restriction enzyme S subunit